MAQGMLLGSLNRLIMSLDTTAVTYMAFNFIASVGIVFANKIVFHTFEYNYATFMTALHFFVTYGGLLINKQLGMYQVKKLSHWDVLPITVSFCAFVVFNNLSLQYNTVGFYQLMKVLTTPVVVVLQNLIYGVDLPYSLKLALMPICLGVAMATVNDFSFNLVGTFWATAGLVATAFYQLLVKTRQDKLEAPQSALFVTACTPLFDNTFGPNGFLEYRYTAAAVVAILVSCVLAYCVNLSTYLVIGRTSPVSYQVLGHFKLLVILSSGILFMGEDRNTWRLLGMLLSFIGIVSYTTLRQNLASEWKQKKQQQGAGEEHASLKEFEGTAVKGTGREEGRGMVELVDDEERQ